MGWERELVQINANQNRVRINEFGLTDLRMHLEMRIVPRNLFSVDALSTIFFEIGLGSTDSLRTENR